MIDFQELYSKLGKSVPINRVSLSLMLLSLLLLLFGGIRACSRSEREIARAHLYLIARDPTWYPLDLMGKEKSMLAFTSDLILTIAKRRQVKLEIINVSSNYLLEGLKEKEYGAVISSMPPTALSNKTYNFSTPFYTIGPVLIVPVDSTVQSLKEMKNSVIAVNRNADLTIDITDYNALYKPYDSMTKAFNDLYNGRIDGIILPVMQAYTYIDTFHKGRFKVITEPLNDEGLRLVTRQTLFAEFLITEFDEGLKEIISDGTYQTLCDKWGLVNPMQAINSKEAEKK